MISPKFRKPFLCAIGIVSALAGVTAADADDRSTTPRRLVREEFPWPFQRVPMPGAPRSVVIPLSANVHLAFDVKTLRTHLVWAGAKLQLGGYVFGGAGEAMCRPGGAILWTAPTGCPWVTGDRTVGLAAAAPGGSDFRGVSTRGGLVSIVYDVAEESEKLVRIHETPRVEHIGGLATVVRRFEAAPHERSIWFLAHAETASAGAIRSNGVTFMFPRSTNVLAVSGHGAIASWNPASTSNETRLWCELAPSSTPVAFEILGAVCANEAEAARFAESARTMRCQPPRSDAARVLPTSAGSRPPVFPAATAPGRPVADRFLKREVFPVPPELDALVGGLDWLPGGDLLLATWPGEIYRVENASRDLTNVTFRRFAFGLNEPLGLKVVNGQVYVAQKCELTRLADTDGDGEADWYECVNDDWGFDGDMHYFAYGPACDSEGNFYVTLDANTMAWKPRWELPFRGWTVRISPDGRRLDGVASGLRSPNGCFTFAGDVFCPDNEGHWIGTCKLNQPRANKFFGYPSATPLAKERFDQPGGFDPPAVWLPRRLSTSASGGVEIPAGCFGPFGGQLLLGDFGTSSILRVALEKVNGEWQGAVWPFARGFLSGVNRLAFGPDGKLYVGGLRRGWAASGPQDFSLERVSWTGDGTNAPFEVLRVAAKPDGFELRFTEPVDAASAASPDNWSITQFGYKFHATYGSPECDHTGKENSATPIIVSTVEVSRDARSVRLKLEGWRAGFVTSVQTRSVRNARGEPLRNDTFYYTLNQIPR